MESYDYSALCNETLFYTLNAGVSHVLNIHRIPKLKSS